MLDSAVKTGYVNKEKLKKSASIRSKDGFYELRNHEGDLRNHR